MSTHLMIKSNLNGNVIDIERNSSQAATNLDAFPPKVSTPTLGGTPTPFAGNQTWEVLPDPAGSSHYIIKNPGTGYCIDIKGASQSPGTALDVFNVQSSDNQNQLWDFLPDPFGSGSCFVQNPQTGYVIEIANGSSAAGAALVVNPRRLFANNHQLWSAVQGSFLSAWTFPSLTLAPQPAIPFGSNNQYVLLTPNQTTNIQSFTVTFDIVEDLVASSFSIQINGNAPSPGGVNDNQWFAQWSQFGLIMQNNSLVLFNQAWRGNVPDAPGDPLASVATASPQIFSIQNNTIPAGTQIVLSLTFDSSHDNFATGVSGQVFSNGAPVGTPQNWPLIGRQTFHPGGPVQESDLSPLGALSVVVVGPPSGNTIFTSGMGTITVKCNPALTVSSQLNGPNPKGIQTGEESNCYYGQVQQGSFNRIVQPFGVPSPKITSASGNTTVTGTGLYPNSSLTAKADYSTPVPAQACLGNVEIFPSHADGSFSCIVTPQDPNFVYKPDATLTITVTDSLGNSAWANIINLQNPRVLSTAGSQSTYFGTP